MKFIKPKVDWLISERAKHTVKAYAEYTEHDGSEVVNLFVLNLLEDGNHYPSDVLQFLFPF